jgi:hypothetical protein
MHTKSLFISLLILASAAFAAEAEEGYTYTLYLKNREVTTENVEIRVLVDGHASAYDRLRPGDVEAVRTIELTLEPGKHRRRGRAHYFQANEGRKMRKSAFLIAACVLAVAAAAFGRFGSVVNSWMSPQRGHYPEDCTGLAWDGAYIWCSVHHGIGYAPYMYRCRPSDGSVVSSFRSGFNDDLRGYGMCHRKIGGTNYLDVVVCDRNAYEYYIYRYDYRGSITGRMKLQVPVAMGLFHDGSNFWVTRPKDPLSVVYKLNANGSPLSSFVLNKEGYPLGICQQGDFFWLSIDYYGPPGFYGGYKVRRSGSVVASFLAPGISQYTYDCTFDGEYLWIASFTNMVYQVDVSNAPAVVPTSVGRIKALFR